MAVQCSKFITHNETKSGYTTRTSMIFCIHLCIRYELQYRNDILIFVMNKFVWVWCDCFLNVFFPYIFTKPDNDTHRKHTFTISHIFAMCKLQLHYNCYSTTNKIVIIITIIKQYQEHTQLIFLSLSPYIQLQYDCHTLQCLSVCVCTFTVSVSVSVSV